MSRRRSEPRVMITERLGSYLILSVLCLSLLCLHIHHAHAGALPFQNLECPLLVGSTDVESIDIGGDGITDFVCVGRFVFAGATRLDSPIPPITEMVHVIIRNRGGEWRSAQSFSANGNVESLCVSDMNDDGLDDLLLVTRVYPILTLACYLQAPDGTLVPGADMILSGEDRTRYPLPIGDHSGRVLVLNTGFSAQEPALVGELLQFEPANGFRSLWTDSLRASFGWLRADTADILPTQSGGIVITTGSMPLGICVGIPMGSDGWGEPFQLPLQYRDADELLILERNGRSEAWCWLASSIDTLRMMSLVGDGEGLEVTAMPIAGMSPDSLTNTFNGACARDSSAYFWYTWNDIAEQSFVSVIEVSPTNDVSVVSRWPKPPGSALRMALRADAEPELVWAGQGGNLTVPVLTGPPGRAPDRAIPIQGSLACADFNGDGFPDVVTEANSAGIPDTIQLLMGLGRSPWFGDAAAIGAFDYVGGGCAADLDGDGDTDVVLAALDYTDSSTSFVPAFWDGASLRCREDRKVAAWSRVEKFYIGDFDRDSRPEVLGVWTNLAALFEWTPDQQPLPRVNIRMPDHTKVVGVGDLDGEQGEEIVTTSRISSSKVSLEVRKFDPAAGALSEPLASWEAADGFGLVADLDGRGEPGVCWFGRESVEYVRLERPSARPVGRISLPLPLLWGYAEASARDIDADGRTDIVIQGVGAQGRFEVILDPLGEPLDRVLTFDDEPALHRAVSIQVPGWVDLDRDGDLDLVAAREDGFYVMPNEALNSGDEAPRLLWVRPTSSNPCRDAVRFAVRLDAGGALSVEMFDAVGRRVWQESRGAPADHWLEIRADRRAGRRPLPSGVYLLRFGVNGKSDVRRVVFVD